MNLKSIISLEFSKNNKDFAFLLPSGSMFGECFQVVDELVVELKKMEEQQKAQADVQNQEKPIEPELV